MISRGFSGCHRQSLGVLGGSVYGKGVEIFRGTLLLESTAGPKSIRSLPVACHVSGQLARDLLSDKGCQIR